MSARKKELNVLIVGETEEEVEAKKGEVESLVEVPVSISLNSVVGINNSKTMNAKVKI